MTINADRTVSLYIVTGFLGSGKTTLIAALLAQPEMQGTAIIVNEFGSVGIDDAIFAETLDSDKIYLLSNGCLCCAPGDDLIKSIKHLLALHEPPDRIVLETSGLADPSMLLQRLMSDRDTSSLIRIRGIVTAVDGVDGLNTLERHAVSRRQAAIADQRIVTKADIANRTTLDELSQQLTALNPGGSITFSSNGNINARDILGAVHFDPFENESSLSSWFNIDAYHAHARLHTSDRFLADAGVRSWTIRGEHPVDWSILSKRLGAIVAQFGDTLLRLKGIVYTTGEQRPFVIHSVSRLFHAPKRMKDSKIRSGCTIVIIGESGAEPAVQLVRDAVAAASLTNKSFSMQNLLQ